MENWFNRRKTFYSQRKKRCYKKGAAVKVLLDETSDEEKLKLLDHIFSCPECNAEFEALREIWIKGKDILHDLEKMKFTKENANRLKKIAKKEIKTLKYRKRAKRSLLFHPKKIIAIASGIVIVVIISLFVLLRESSIVELERKIEPGKFEVIEPWGKIINSFILFRWTLIHEAEDYTLEILDNGLESFYRKEHIKNESFKLPEDIFIRLAKRKTYFWKVIANLENDQKIESEFAKFHIKNN